MLGFLRPHLRGSLWSLAVPQLPRDRRHRRDPAAARARRRRDPAGRPRRRAAAVAGDRRRRHAAARAAVPRRLIAGRVSLGVEYDLRNRVYRHLQSLELGFFDRQQTGPADVARDGRPAVGAVLPRLRADLHPPEPAHDPARGRGDVRAPAVAGGDHARARAARDRSRPRATAATRGRRCRRCSSGSRS